MCRVLFGFVCIDESRAAFVVLAIRSLKDDAKGFLVRWCVYVRLCVCEYGGCSALYSYAKIQDSSPVRAEFFHITTFV